MSAVLDQDSIISLSQSPPKPSKALSNRLGLPIGFLLGVVLAGAISFIAWQDAAVVKATPSPLPAPPVQTDPRLERLLSLTESQRDCDTACLGDLRVKADKVAALEEALGNLNAEAADAGQRFATLEAEKVGWVEQMSGKETALTESQRRVEALEKDKVDLSTQIEKQKAELETGYKRQIAALETEKNALTESGKAELAAQLEKQKAELEAGYKQQVAALETEKNALAESGKAELAAQLEKQKAELETGYQQQIAAVEAEKNALAESGKAELAAQLEKQKAELETGYQQQIAAVEAGRNALAERGRAELAVQLQKQKSEIDGYRQRQSASQTQQLETAQHYEQNPAQGTANAQTDAGKKWTIIGMTDSTVVVTTPGRRVVALAAGETMGGLTVHHIDLGKGVAQTNIGDLQYVKKEK